jgi:hypothetical protein
LAKNKVFSSLLVIIQKINPFLYFYTVHCPLAYTKLDLHLLAIFRTNQLLAGILLLGYAALLRISWFWQDIPALAASPGIGNSWLVPWLNANPTAHFVLPLLLLFFQAILANSIVFTHRLAATVNLFPGVFVILSGSLLPSFLPYSGYVVANLLLLLSVRSLLLSFRTNSAADTIFNVGFYLGLAVLFVPAYLCFILAISITLPLLKSGKFRDQFILILGALTPIYLLGIYYFWTDSFKIFWDIQWTNAFSLPQVFDWSALLSPDMLIMPVLLIFVIFNQGKYLTKTKMDVQIKISILYWILLGAGFAAIWIIPWQLQLWQITVPMVGILLSFSFTKAKNSVAESWHLILLLLLFMLHFLFLFQF